MLDTVSSLLLSHLNLLVLSILRWTCCSLWFSEQGRTVKLQECGGCCSRRATRGDSSTPFISTCPFVFFLITNPLAIWCMHYSFQPWSTADINTESLPKMCRMSKKTFFFFLLLVTDISHFIVFLQRQSAVVAGGRPHGRHCGESQQQQKYTCPFESLNRGRLRVIIPPTTTQSPVVSLRKTVPFHINWVILMKSLVHHGSNDLSNKTCIILK